MLDAEERKSAALRRHRLRLRRGTEQATELTVEDVTITSTIQCSGCGITHQLKFGGDHPAFIEQAMGDQFADEGWEARSEWYDESGTLHERNVLCHACVEVEEHDKTTPLPR